MKRQKRKTKRERKYEALVTDISRRAAWYIERRAPIPGDLALAMERMGMLRKVGE